MIYWTEWGDSPNIELCDLTGKNRQVIISTGLGWPNGITYDREGEFDMLATLFQPMGPNLCLNYSETNTNIDGNSFNLFRFASFSNSGTLQLLLSSKFGVSKFKFNTHKF